MKAEEAARELEEAQMAVADTAASFVDGDATIAELRKAVADWRKASQALADAVRTWHAKAPAASVDETIARASAPNPPNRRFREITARDVGKLTFHAFGRTWRTVDFIGRIMKQDIGKRVCLVGDCLQVENDEQRAKRREVKACGACARVGTNDTRPIAHAPGCPNDREAHPAHEQRPNITTGNALPIKR